MFIIGNVPPNKQLRLLYYYEIGRQNICYVCALVFRMFWSVESFVFMFAFAFTYETNKFSHLTWLHYTPTLAWNELTHSILRSEKRRKQMNMKTPNSALICDVNDLVTTLGLSLFDFLVFLWQTKYDTKSKIICVLRLDDNWKKQFFSIFKK